MRQSNQFKTIKTTSILFSLLFLFAVIVGCTELPPQPPGPPGMPDNEQGTYEEVKFEPTKEVKLKQFSSDEELAAFLKQNRESDSGWGYGGGIMRSMAVDDMEMMAMDAAMPEAAGEGMQKTESSASNEYSETNVQVAGVDEADIIKTDGNYIYTITDKILYIIKAYPGEDAQIVSRIEFDSRPTSLFIYGDTLSVFGNFQNWDFYNEVGFSSQRGLTFFDIYDISDKSDPELVKEYKFEGNYFNARMVGEHVYFVVQSSPHYSPGIPRPVVFEGTTEKAVPLNDIYYYNIPYRNPQFATVHAIDLDNLDYNSATVTVEGGMNMYMSHENIFITHSQYINEYDLMRMVTAEMMEDRISTADKRIIAKIKATDDDVLSKAEKDNKIYQIYESYTNYMNDMQREEFQDQAEVKLKKMLEDYEHLEYTLIHKIQVENGDVKVMRTGRVPGSILNQFSMDEYDSVFRIATTINSRWSRFGMERSESTNNIYTLSKDMDILDELEELAEGERIYSTRFIGDKLYMVTFRQVDPFFVIDLSDPKHIKELGQLKIPGFSRYLHPYDKDTIIGIGHDATDTGRQTGLKISLFDVSDFKNPKEVAKFVTDERYSQSAAEYEHKAFLFDREKELLVIPAYSYDWNDNDGYNGAFVFKITKSQIMLRGLIDHSNTGSSRYGPQVERSLWINELLYTKSPKLLRINRIEDLGSVKNISLTTTGDIPIY
ncbi:MAG: beta-propeller domain-containing protein [Nanoarchaeota archaeon]|nr:beta-propeller domain-containing protein [Nanoarchaeota archaeon]